MNGIRAATIAAAAASGGPDQGRGIRRGAETVTPVKLIADQQYRTLFPYLHPTGRAQVVGQGSKADFLSVTAYACDQPTGNDLAVVTPIYTPQLYDDYGLSIDGSPLGQSVQNLDMSPGNSAAIGVQGQSGRRLPFVTALVPGKGILPTPYGKYDFKVPPSNSPFVSCPPQGKNALGSTYAQPGNTDRVVNKPLVTVYLADGLTWAKEDADGFTPMELKLGRGLSFGSPDATDEHRRPVQVDLGGSGLSIRAGAAILIDPPTPPTIASVVVQVLNGNVDIGDHEYAAAYHTTDGILSFLSESIDVTNSASHQKNVVTIDPYAAPPALIDELILYRTKVVDTAITFYQLTTFTRTALIAGISYTDNTADASLGAAFTNGVPSVIAVELATDASGNNISGLLENAGADGNGLLIDPYGTGAMQAGPGITINPPAPPDKPNVAIVAGAGLGIGAYLWATTYQYVIAGVTVETNPSYSAGGTTTAGNQQAILTDTAPPVIPGATILGTVVYRTALASTTLQLVALVAGTGSLAYTDSTPDGSLGAAAPHQKYTIETDLANHVVGGVSKNVSGLIDTAGDDAKGLAVNADGVSVIIDPTTGKVTAPGAGGSAITQVQGSLTSIDFPGSIMTWDQLDLNNGPSMWDGLTRLTAPSAGIYMVVFHLIANRSVPATPQWAALFTEFYVNGSPAGPRAQWESENTGVATGGLWWGPSHTTFLQLSAGDYVEAFASLANGGGSGGSTGTSDQYFSMLKVA